jgi:hypothetical protein
VQATQLLPQHCTAAATALAVLPAALPPPALAASLCLGLPDAFVVADTDLLNAGRLILENPLLALGVAALTWAVVPKALRVRRPGRGVPRLPHVLCSTPPRSSGRGPQQAS